MMVNYVSKKIGLRFLKLDVYLSEVFMFESITITRHNSYSTDKPIDIGLLIECLFFYRKVIVVCDYEVLTQIYSYFGGENLHRLLNEGYLDLFYLESNVGIITNEGLHDVTEFDSPQHRFQDKIREICIDARGGKSAGRRLAQRLEKSIKVSKSRKKVLEGAREAILNTRYAGSSARIILNELVPTIAEIEPFRFEPHLCERGIFIDTNIDFQKVNQAYHKLVSPTHSTISSAYILAHMLKLEEELFFSSSNLSELSCSSLSSRLGIIKINYLIERSLKSEVNLDNFKRIILEDVKAIREAVNKNEVDLNKLFSVLEKSKKFKDSIKILSPDEDLCKHYLKEITKEDFFERLPGKALRYSFFKAIDIAADFILPKAVGDVISHGLGIVDSFLFDQVIGGWKPHQYIREVKKLIEH